MYIKRVIIRGFKTYKNETIIEDFSPHHNVVVGRNGSGKSNFFAAIRFVLSDAYNNLNREERQALIHESSVNIMSAFVEIIFDNTDRRIPIPKDEVAIRRTIGMKKDDYSLDYKSATKADVMNLLEASGFSKSNPYYIVPQGKVTALTNAKDSERLELLKEIAGARVFENKLKDSLKEMSITAQKQLQIKEMIADIEKRLDELNIEKEDLKAFEKLNSKKKMLEFNIYDRELRALTNQIDAIEGDYSNSVQETESLITELEAREAKILKLESESNDLKSRKKILEIDLQINSKESEDILQQISSVNIQLQDAKITSGSSVKKESYVQNIKDLNIQIKEHEAQLEDKGKQLKELTINQFEIKSKINDLHNQQMSIISKKNQNSKFSSKTERDSFIQKQIKSLENSKSEKTNLISELEKELEKLTNQLNTFLHEKEKLNDTNNLNDKIEELDNKIINLKSDARNLVDDRSMLWRKESKLNSLINAKKENLSNLEQSLRGTIDIKTLNALETVKTIAKNLGPNVENGVYGYLGELIDVSEKYKTAADVIGGNSLFHIVVNNDQTASILIEELKKERLCRVTFVPLNRLKNDDFSFPNGNDSVPLIKKIAYDEFLAPAVKQVFGRTVVCVSIQRGYELADSHKVNAVTLDGDRCDSEGVLTGGFRDIKASRIDYLKNLRNFKSEIFETKEQLKAVKEDIKSKDFAINSNYQNTIKLKNELDSKLSEKNIIVTKLSKLDSEIAKIQLQISTIDQKLGVSKLSVEGIDKQVSNSINEMNSPFSESQFSDTDENMLQEIYKELPLLEESYHKILQSAEEIELSISSISTMLSEVFNPRLNKLKLELNDLDDIQKDSKCVIEDLESRLIKLQERQKELKDDENKDNIDLSDIKEALEDRENRINDLNKAQEAFVKQFEDYGKSTDKNLVHRLRLRNRKHELERNIGELGVLPEDTLTAFTNETTASLSVKLTKVNEHLKKYNHVNKKAMEQFSKFAKQKASLAGRINELEEAESSIEHLIDVLQNRKNEAIIRAFKEVSVGFSRIFEQLVPAGKGKLVIQKRHHEQVENQISLSQYPDSNNNNSNNNNNNISEDYEIDEGSTSIDSFIGISISVSFNSKKNEQQRLEQLSGGQKSLCALSLILAIQSCDPAPFYLFDEIDSNLDAQYRTAVANLIHKLSQDAQFICTTFRSEMLKVSDRYYGVMFNNKVSTISNIDAERALDFVEDQSHL
jgi:structural maintenance of chromosome 3 (chondroitin sulfate proteoglycan 6)